MRKKWIRGILITLAVILLLITAFVLFLHTAKGKAFVAGQIQSYLRKKLQTEVSIGKLNYRLPDWIELRNVVLKDKNNKTLLSGKEMRVDIDMLKLISSDVEIDKIFLSGININIYRDHLDSNFSYQFLIDAFTSKKTDTVSSKEPMQISLSRLDLDTINLRYNDAKEGRYYSATIGNFRAGMDSIDITQLNFKLKDWHLRNTTVTIVDSSVTVEESDEPEDTAKSSPLVLRGSSLALKNVAFTYKKVNDKFAIDSRVDSLRLNNPYFDLSEQWVVCESLTLQNSMYAMETVSAPEKDETAKTATVSKPWSIRCDTLLLDGNTFRYNNNFYKPAGKGIDYNHLVVNNIALDAENTTYVNNRLQTTLWHTSLDLNDIISLKRAGAIVNFSDSLLTVQDALVAVNNSQVKTRGTLNIPLKKQPFKDAIEIQLDSSFVALQDIETIAPGTVEKLPVEVAKGDRINFDGSFSGTMERIQFSDLMLYTGNRHFVFLGTGRVENATVPDRLRYTVAIRRLHADTRLLKPDLQAKLREKDVQLPPALDATGSITGTTTSADTKNFILNSEYGKAILNGSVKNFNNTDRISYNLTLEADELETGKWIGKDSLLGKLSGKVAVNGSGTKPEQLIADVDLAIRSVVVKGYDYSDINLNGSYDKGAFTANGGINDENLVTRLDLKGNVLEENISATGNIAVDKADLYALKLTADSFRLYTNVILDAKNLQPDALDAHIFIDSSLLFVTGKKIYVDSIQVDGERRNDSTFISMASPFLVASLNGKYKYDDLAGQVNHYIQANYFDKSDTITEVPTQAAFKAELTSHDMVTYINPELILEKPIGLTASFDNRDTDTVLKADFYGSAFYYRKIGSEEVRAGVTGVDSALQFNVTADKLVSGSQTYLKPTVKGSFNNKLVRVDASTKDNDDKDFYGVKGTVLLEDEKTTIRLTDNLLLNAEPWQVGPDNSLVITPQGYIFNDFTIRRGEQLLSLTNAQPGTVSDINVNIDSFDLGSIMAFANKDSMLADGRLQGDVTVGQPFKEVPEVKGKLSVQALRVKNIPIGNAELISDVSGGNVEVNAKVTGENLVTIRANAGINTGSIDANVNLEKLDMKSIEAFSGGKVNRATGLITGRATISGTIKEPRWSGELNFNEAAFALAEFNSLYRIRQEKLVFDYPNIRVNQFEITDTLNNPLSLDGSITALDNGTFDLDMAIRARNFIAINAPRKSGSTIYGTGIVDATVQVSGNSTQPSIQGNATLDKGSNVFYIIPQSNNYAEERDEVVSFIKLDTIDNLGYRVPDTTIKLPATTFRGVTYNLNLQVNKEATLTVVVDPLTNDELQIQGTAQINAGIDESGRVGLSGVYNLESGYYNMNYQLIKRKFALVKGSTITFSGDPKEAVADITAQYETDASASDLLGNEIMDGTAAGQGFTNKIPFLVILTIKGSLTKPELGFDIKLKEGAAGVNSTVVDAIENKLAQIRYDVSAMNKQVFGLLIMNRFIGEKSSDFFGGGGFHADAVARESVSRFLTEAVNQIADDLIKGVDIDINLKNYEAIDNTINRTDVDVALSKRLLNDRLSVSVGKNFTVEGNDPVTQTQQNSNVQYIPDITTTYKLSKDGRYMIRAYRRNQYEAQVDGYFIETGAVFSISMDYNRFRQLFERRKVREARRLKNQQNRERNKQER
jgi:translocation and assembly module TamB